MKSTRHIVKPIKGLWNPKRSVWMKKNDDEDLGGDDNDMGDDDYNGDCSRCRGTGQSSHGLLGKSKCVRCGGSGKK